MSRLAGKAAIITGAARGIGQAMALRFAEEGCNLALTDLNLDGVEETAELARQHGVEVIAMKADVSSRSDVEAMVAGAVEAFNGVDAVVNNAGIFFNEAIIDMTDEQWDRMMTINVKSVFLVSQAVIKHWLHAERPGSIVNLASISAAIAFKNSAAYCTAKAAVASFTRVAALEYGDKGIRANSIAPGIIETTMLPDPAGAQEWARNKIPLTSLGQPEDVANLAVFLASDESRYITGDMIFVDGGWMLE